MDIKASVLRSFTNACGLFLKDLEALPESAFTQKFGEKTRTIADIVYEVNLVNDHIGMVIRGEKPFDWPEGGYIYAPEGFDTKEKVIEAFQQSSDKIKATIESFSNEDLEATVQTDHGEQARFAQCQFMTMHLWYHSGQFNYIQTLLGDDGWHWH